MGCYFSANGKLVVKPEVTEDLIKEYIDFSRNNFPDDYCRENNWGNPWIFDSDNLLICLMMKYGGPIEWYEFIKKEFCEKRGYELIGEMLLCGEGDTDFWDIEKKKLREEYVEWRERVRKIDGRETYYEPLEGKEWGQAYT